jgi:hypothetical protein
LPSGVRRIGDVPFFVVAITAAHDEQGSEGKQE